MPKTLLPMLLLLGSFACAKSSEAKAMNGWISGGVGFGTHLFAYAGNISFVIGDSWEGNWLVSLRSSVTDERKPVSFQSGPTEKSSDVALLLGIVRGESSRTFSASVGPASVSTKHQEKVIGAAFQSQLMMKHVGLIIFANLNSAQSFAGVTLSLRIPY